MRDESGVLRRKVCERRERVRDQFSDQIATAPHKKKYLSEWAIYMKR
jgi:hypothetical protein